jgi:hypothetical protein
MRRTPNRKLWRTLYVPKSLPPRTGITDARGQLYMVQGDGSLKRLGNKIIGRQDVKITA